MIASDGRPFSLGAARLVARKGSFRREPFDLRAAGRRLRAEWLEPDGARDEAIPLVFLHEGLGSIAQWREFPLLVSVATGHPALVYERWGFGGSDAIDGPRPVDYLERESWESLPDVLLEAGIGQCVLIGHSDGGSIALIYASRHSDRLVGAVTLAAHVFVEDVTMTGIREATSAFDEGSLREKLARYHGPNTETMFRGWSDTWLSPAFRTWNIERLLPSVTCPLLILQGADDEYGSSAQMDAIIDRVGGPVRGQLFPNCGHTPHCQAPDAVFQAVAGFVAEITQ